MSQKKHKKLSSDDIAPQTIENEENIPSGTIGNEGLDIPQNDKETMFIAAKMRTFEKKTTRRKE